MEEWELDYKWLEVRHRIKDLTGQNALPDLNAVLFLIGIRELGQIKDQFTKEEKQDLMHIAACRLLSERGYYEFEGLDQDGWPHWKTIKHFDVKGVKNQSSLLKELIINYFNSEALFEEE